jgi:hypothetical protein
MCLVCKPWYKGEDTWQCKQTLSVLNGENIRYNCNTDDHAHRMSKERMKYLQTNFAYEYK